MEKENVIFLKDINEWRKWLEKNHLKEKSVSIVRYKKHTGKQNFFGNEPMMQAICFGWIDTTVKRINEEYYIQKFVKRNKNSRWSINTLSYGKKLLEQNQMSDYGIKMYKEGLLKKPHDADLPKDPEIPKELKIIFKKDKKLKEKFLSVAPSIRRMYLRMHLRAQRPETKEKRIKEIIEACKKIK